MVIWKRFLYLLSRPLILRKSSCSKASIASSTLSHILASTWPLRSPEDEREIRLSGLLGFDLLGNDHETGGDDFVFVVAAIG